ncbi:MAG: pyridoxal phosphate-dependent aminotransferase [Acidobacteriota bacterium]
MRDFALETFFSEWEFLARHHMTASDIESFSLPELLAMASNADREAFENQWLGYTQTYGAPELRREIAGTFEALEAEDILCFAGAEEGLYAAMRVLLRPEDHAVVVVPNYQAAETLPLEICEVSGVALDPERGWALDPLEVERQLRPNTRLVSINFPNNPTGAIPTLEVFDALVSLCRRRGLYLMSDEVYRQVERDPARRLPQAADVYERGLSLNVLSKAYGLPGLRVGWIGCRDRDLLEKLERYKHYLSICNSAPSERLALIALRARERILERNRALLAENRDLLKGFMDGYPHLFGFEPPDGGCVAFPRYLGPGSADDFCHRLLQEAGVLLLPPRLYRSELLETPQDRFRIGFGRRGLGEGLEALRGHLEARGLAAGRSAAS